MTDWNELVAIGDRLLKEGNWQKASEAFGKALFKIDGPKDVEIEEIEIASILRRKAQADSRMGYMARAKMLLDRAIQISERLEDMKGIAETLRGIGYILNLSEDMDGALERYREALRIAKDIGDAVLQGRLHVDLGNLLQYNYEYEASKEEYGQAILLLKDKGADAELARAHNNLGEAYKLTGDLDTAMVEYWECLRLSESEGDETMRAFAFLNQAECLALTGDTELARTYLNATLDIMERTRDRIGLANAYHVGGIMALEEEDFAGAKYMLEKSLELCKELEMPRFEGEVLRTLAKVYISIDDDGMAKRILNLAIETFKKKDRTKDLENTRSLLHDLG